MRAIFAIFWPNFSQINFGIEYLAYFCTKRLRIIFSFPFRRFQLWGAVCLFWAFFFRSCVCVNILFSHCWVCKYLFSNNIIFLLYEILDWFQSEYIKHVAYRNACLGRQAQFPHPSFTIPLLNQRWWESEYILI